MSINNDYIEVDAPWFSAQWLLDHPDMPLARCLDAGFDEHMECAA